MRSSFVSPPLEVLQESQQQARETHRTAARRSVSEGIRFEGESSSHRDFAPPPHDALLASFRPERRAKSSDGRRSVGEQLRFQGESSSHRDFPPPPRDPMLGEEQSRSAGSKKRAASEGLRTHLEVQRPAELPRSRLTEAAQQPEVGQGAAAASGSVSARPRPASSRTLEVVYKEPVQRFDGQSCMRADFLPPPPAAQRKSPAAGTPTETSARPSGLLKGETFETFRTPSNLRAAGAPTLLDKSTDAASARPKSAPRDRSQVRDLHALDATPCTSFRMFEGESSMRRDFRAPAEVRDLHRAGQTPRERARSMPADARPGQVARPPGVAAPRAFTGESSSHRDFAPPPRDAYQRSQRNVKSQQLQSEGRDFATTSQVAFGTPPRPAIRKLLSSDNAGQNSSCPAGDLCAVQPPPKPANGREHVYYDQGSKAWY